jgi:hypothetical protein
MKLRLASSTEVPKPPGGSSGDGPEGPMLEQRLEADVAEIKVTLRSIQDILIRMEARMDSMRVRRILPITGRRQASNSVSIQKNSVNCGLTSRALKAKSVDFPRRGPYSRL